MGGLDVVLLKKSLFAQARFKLFIQNGSFDYYRFITRVLSSRKYVLHHRLDRNDVISVGFFLSLDDIEYSN